MCHIHSPMAARHLSANRSCTSAAQADASHELDFNSELMNIGTCRSLAVLRCRAAQRREVCGIAWHCTWRATPCFVQPPPLPTPAAPCSCRCVQPGHSGGRGGIHRLLYLLAGVLESACLCNWRAQLLSRARIGGPRVPLPSLSRAVHSLQQAPHRTKHTLTPAPLPLCLYTRPVALHAAHWR